MMVVATYLCQRSDNSNISLISDASLHSNSTTSQFSTSFVTTNLVSSTEPISEATFPKVVICNKYRLRYNCKQVTVVFGFSFFFNRKAFVMSMVDSIKNHTGQTSYTDHEISLVLYKQLISGWGFNTNPAEVDLLICRPSLSPIFSPRINGFPRRSAVCTMDLISLSTTTFGIK